MQAAGQKSESPGRHTQGFQEQTTKTTKVNLSQGVAGVNGQTASESFSAHATYRTLSERRRKLQEQHAHCELDLKLSAQDPDFYSAEKLAEIRERSRTVRAELERVTHEEGSLLEDCPELKEQLKQESRSTSNGPGAEDGASSPSASAEKPIVTLRRPAELIAQPISWRVESILPDGMLTVMHARDKIGKTLLAWEAAAAILKKQPFLGTFSVTPGRVVLALLDDPVALTVARRDALALKDCDNLRIVTPVDADLSDPKAFLAAFKAVCEEFKPQLIVIDALYQFAPPGRDSMNDVARMRGPIGVFNTLAETLPAAVVVIAHDRNDGSDVAGSHVIRATAKALLHLTKPRWTNDEEEDDGRRILTVVSKLTGETRHLLRNKGVGQWTYVGRGDSARQARTTWAQDRVLAWLKEGGEGTAPEIAKAVGIRKEDALTALTDLVENNRATQELMPRADGKKGKGRLIYRLKPIVPDPGNDSPKEGGGNNRSDSLKPALDVAQSSIPIVPPALNQAGTVGQVENPRNSEGLCENQSYCSQNPLFSAGTIVDQEEGEL